MQNYSLDEVGSGRFDVRAINGLRIGHIIGGNGSWAAEADNRTIGFHKTIAASADAILKHRGIKGIDSQMSKILAKRFGKTAYIEGFNADANFIERWHCAANLIWIVTQSSSQLLTLDLPHSAENFNMVMASLAQNAAASPPAIYLVDFDLLKVIPLTESKARGLLAVSPKYSCDNGIIKQYGKEVARITHTIAPQGSAEPGKFSNVTVECTTEPSPGMVSAFSFMAFDYLTHDMRDLHHGVSEYVEVRMGRTSYYRWPKA